MIRSMFIQSGEWVIISKAKFHIKNKFIKSLRFRIALLIIVAGIIPCAVLFLVVFNRYEAQSVDMRIAEIQNQCTILGNHLNMYNYLNDPSSEVINAELTQVGNIYNGRVIVVDQDMRIIKDTYDMDEGKTIVSSGMLSCFQGSGTTNYDERNQYLEVTAPITDPESGNVIGALLVSVSTNSIADVEERLQAQVGAVLALICMLLIIFGMILSSLMTKPLDQLAKSLSEVTEGYGEITFHENAYTETEAMSQAINEMLGRLKAVDDSRQEFVSNVSHELKTPLASMKVLADSLLTQEEVPIELYREFMGDITEEIERENVIIEDLLSLVKMDRSAPDLNIQPMSMNDLLELILKRLKPIAAKKNVEVIYESFRPVTAEIDEVKMTLAISNLVENAIKYNKDEGWVHVSLNADHKYCYIKVSDSGMGIPEQDQDHIFERFYRVDKSHSREIGGTGLGLAITRSAIVLHRGAVKVYSKEGEGTTFTVRIPLNYVV